MTLGRTPADILAERGRADAFAARPRASEHPLYYYEYYRAAVQRRVRDAEAIIAAAPGEQCPACGHDAAGQLFFCGCEGDVPARTERGFYVLFGVETDGEQAEFRANSCLRRLMADGTPLLNALGEDISSAVNPLQ